MSENVIIEKLDKILSILETNNTASKTVLNFDETCSYLNLSKSHLYKLTSQKKIPHSCPTGKKLYFDKIELDTWLLENSRTTDEQILKQANSYNSRRLNP